MASIAVDPILDDGRALELPRIEDLDQLTVPIDSAPSSENADRQLEIAVTTALRNREPGIEQQLRTLAEALQFDLQTVQSPSFWAEDSAIKMGPNAFLVSNFDRDQELITAAHHLTQLDLDGAPGGQGRTVGRSGFTTDGPTECQVHAQHLIAQGFAVEESRFLIEGGNLLTTGDTTIVGRSTIVLNMFALERRNFFDTEQVVNTDQETRYIAGAYQGIQGSRSH